MSLMEAPLHSTNIALVLSIQRDIDWLMKEQEGGEEDVA